VTAIGGLRASNAAAAATMIALTLGKFASSIGAFLVLIFEYGIICVIQLT
jgi:hypothetical protein